MVDRAAKRQIRVPDSYEGFIDSTIQVDPLSAGVIRFEGFDIPKAYSAQFTLLDPYLKKNKDLSARWFVQIYVEVSEFGTQELMEYRIKGSTFEWTDFQDFGIYSGFSGDARAVQRWQSAFVTSNLNQFILRAGINIAQSYEKTSDGWARNNRANNLSFKQEKVIANSLDKRIHQKLTPDFLKEVATIYSQSVQNGEQPTKYLMSHFEIPRATASRWVRGARDLKLLPPALESGKASRPNKKFTNPKHNQKEAR